MLILSSMCAVVERLHDAGYNHGSLSLHNIVVEIPDTSLRDDTADGSPSRSSTLEDYISMRYIYKFINFNATTTHLNREDYVADYDTLIAELDELTGDKSRGSVIIMRSFLTEYIRNRIR